MPDFQLYHEGMTLDMPWSVSYPRNSGKPTVIKKKFTNQVYMYWPNGAPCTLINIWLQSVTAQSTGNSATTFAIHMSHYIRYCFGRNLQLLDIDDDSLSKFSKHLLDQKKLKHSALADKRNANHVAYTIRRVLDFLIWYQMNYRLTSQTKLIGELGSGAKVTIEWRIGDRGQPMILHPAIPTKRPPVGDKKPMPDEFIGKLTDIIETLRAKSTSPLDPMNSPKALIRQAKSDYLYSRRMITVKLQKLTGLRPDELNSIPLLLNMNPIEKRRIFIPTLKTRQIPRPIREFPLTLEDAIEIATYLHDRKRFLESIPPKNNLIMSFLLGHNGDAVETRSLARDFKRLCISAGLKNVQVCLSMFRHRFITTQIAYEIKLELKRDLAHKDLWLEAVQRRILTKVAKLTGHTDPMSLKTYFDEAYALVVTNSLNKTPSQKATTISLIAADIDELSRDSNIQNNPTLARKIALMEKRILELKASDFGTDITD